MTTSSPVALTTSMICAASAGRVVAGDPSRTFDGVSTDSRTVPPQALFVALEGDRFDGHAFTDQAQARGATGLLVARAPETPGAATVIVVDDTLAALQAIANAVRRASGATVVAITGSAGKTTTKEVTADLLGLRYRVQRNAGNLNNHIGLPLSLIELRSGPEMAVVELGMNHAGEIRTLVGIAEPNVRVWTNVGDAHIGAFGTRDAIARAKAEILEQAHPDTLVVANADDALVMRHLSGWGGRRLTFGESSTADIRATDVVDLGFDGIAAHVTTPAGPIDLRVPLPGRPHLMNVLAALSVAIEFGVSLDAIEQKVRTLRAVARRGSSTTGPNGIRVIDDSYNASPSAVMATLAALYATEAAGRRVAVLGEMLELGENAPELHEAVGRAAAYAGIELLVVVGGPVADRIADGAVAEGMDRSRVHRFATSVEAAGVVASLVRNGDVVLVKGSRGVRTDVVADRLLEVA